MIFVTLKSSSNGALVDQFSIGRMREKHRDTFAERGKVRSEVVRYLESRYGIVAGDIENMGIHFDGEPGGSQCFHVIMALRCAPAKKKKSESKRKR